jgi:hypothetical protein
VWRYAAGMAVHTDFWVAVATISPIAIATNLLTVGKVIVHKDLLPRDDGETSWTSWLRERHLYWVGMNLGLCVVLIGFGLSSLWLGTDKMNGWLAITLLMIMLVELCILPICTEFILLRRHLKKGEIAARA